MSINTGLFCSRCKLFVCIGQGHSTLYTAHPEIMEDLRRFLYLHEAHPLFFSPICEEAYEGYEEAQTMPLPGELTADERDARAVAARRAGLKRKEKFWPPCLQESDGKERS